MSTKRRYYVTGDGTKYPLYEAPYPIPITIYKSDCKKAVIGDPEQCLLALGARRTRGVIGAFIGAGKDAYVIFGATKQKPAHALHFTINAKAGRMRDAFDKDNSATTKVIELSPVSNGRTLAHRSKLDKILRAKIKKGQHTPKKLGRPLTTRVMRVGVSPRPKPTVESNVVSIRPRKEAA